MLTTESLSRTLTDATQLEDFTTEVRHAVLDALDLFATENGVNIGITDGGWKDQDLPVLFLAIDAHAKVLWERFGRDVAMARARKEVQS